MSADANAPYFENASCGYRSERWHFIRASFDLAIVIGAVRC
jgi:hypothetical protein